MTFFREVLPLTIRAHFFGNPTASAMIFSTAAFALPRSAGALTRTLRVSSIHPAISSREDEGITLSDSLIVDPLSAGRLPLRVVHGPPIRICTSPAVRPAAGARMVPVGTRF